MDDGIDRRRLDSFFLAPSHGQNNAELCVAAHHACVSLARFERIGFNHGAHTGEFGKAQGISASVGVPAAQP